MEDANLVQPIAASGEIPAQGELAESFTQSVMAMMRGEVTTATSDLALKVLLPAGTALLMLIVTYFVAKLISRWVSAVLCKHVDKTLGKFFGKLSFYTVLTIAGLAILQTAGIGITSFAAILAAAGFAIGLAFQGTLSNFASGVLLLVFRPFKVGDLIQAAGVLGRVNEIDLFTTTFDTPDNRRLIIPNSAIAGTTIENITYHKHRRVDVMIGIEYAASLDKTRAVLTRCAENLADVTVQGEGRGFQVLLTNLGSSSVEWTVRVWAASEKFFPVKERLTTEIKKQLDNNDIKIPFPQMQLHLSENSPLRPTAEHSSLPIPKMNTLPPEGRTTSIRPRARS